MQPLTYWKPGAMLILASHVLFCYARTFQASDLLLLPNHLDLTARYRHVVSFHTSILSVRDL